MLTGTKGQGGGIFSSKYSHVAYCFNQLWKNLHRGENSFEIEQGVWFLLTFNFFQDQHSTQVWHMSYTIFLICGVHFWH